MTNEFKNFAVKHMGIATTTLEDYMKAEHASMTPYILEEREMRVTQMDIFSRLMKDRIIWIGHEVNDHMSQIVQAQLMFLDNLSQDDITMHIDTPGGSVKSGLSMYDVMNYIHSDIITINTGMAASMGSILLGAGTKGKRYSLKHSRVMLHQLSSGTSGNIQDTRIQFEESEKYNKILFDILGNACDKKPSVVLKDAERDKWLNAEEAKAYGIIDDIIIKKPGKK